MSEPKLIDDPNIFTKELLMKLWAITTKKEIMVKLEIQKQSKTEIYKEIKKHFK